MKLAIVVALVACDADANSETDSNPDSTGAFGAADRGARAARAHSLHRFESLLHDRATAHGPVVALASCAPGADVVIYDAV